MFQILKARFFQGYRTGTFPPGKPNLPPHFQGVPVIEKNTDLKNAANICPVSAVNPEDDSIDLGKCIFCGKCAEHCPGLRFTEEYRMGSMTREHLVIRKEQNFTPEEQKREGIRKLCGKSLKIRQVSAGGCAACELDFNVLHTLAWDMGRFGIQAVASPRHADCVLVTGPVTKNMLIALKKTKDAMPDPCFVIASGTCAVSGGLYTENTEVCGGVDKIIPVDLYVPGCPPHPAVLLDALLRFIGNRNV